MDQIDELDKTDQTSAKQTELNLALSPRVFRRLEPGGGSNKNQELRKTSKTVRSHFDFLPWFGFFKLRPTFLQLFPDATVFSIEDVL